MTLEGDRIVRAYTLTEKEKRRLADVLARAYLLAKAQAYQRSETKTRQIIVLRHPWQPRVSDVKRSLARARKHVESIANTYETLLRHTVEEALSQEAERALGDIPGKMKQVSEAVATWFKGFLPWKMKQILTTAWGSGEHDGTAQWIDDVQNDEDDTGDAEQGDINMIRVRVVPEESSSDFCMEYAGKTYTLEEAYDIPDFPAHPNCMHTIEVYIEGETT